MISKVLKLRIASHARSNITNMISSPHSVVVEIAAPHARARIG
jgi:hypothetical protein